MLTRMPPPHRRFSPQIGRSSRHAFSLIIGKILQVTVFSFNLACSRTKIFAKNVCQNSAWKNMYVGENVFEEICWENVWSPNWKLRNSTFYSKIEEYEFFTNCIWNDLTLGNQMMTSTVWNLVSRPYQELIQ